MKIFRGLLLALVAALVIAKAVLAGGDIPTGFSNQNGITNTRHNMTQSSMRNQFGGPGVMNSYRNNYGEVCVYCHTPHGANTSAKVPLWNRNLPTTLYTTYDQLHTSTLTQTVYQPGAASLPCLSCHDGAQAIDAVINTPGSGTYANNVWTPAIAGLPYGSSSGGSTASHLTLTECMACHSPGAGIVGANATDFTVFVIGTDLRNDHPVGVKFPAVNGGATDWKTPNGTVARAGLTTKFFDENADGHMDKGDIRLYDSGNGASVECASCHDPHGVPSGGPGSVMNPTFLRKTNQSSAVCFTCHSK